MRVIVNWPHALSSNQTLLNQLGTATGAFAASLNQHLASLNKDGWTRQKCGLRLESFTKSTRSLSRREILTIARRFNAGSLIRRCRSPEGTAECSYVTFQEEFLA